MDLKQEALRFAEHLQRLYFEQRDLNALLPILEDETSWIGTGVQELCYNLEDAKRWLSQEAQEYGGRFTVTQARYDARCLSETVCLLYGEVTAKPENTALADLYHRLTAICVSTPQGLRLAHLHLSTPDVNQERDCLYVRREDALEREVLRLRAKEDAAQLQERKNQLEGLMKNSPGGVHQCRCDEGLSFLSMSRSFLTLVGYTSEEILEKFHNRFAEMIDPLDLERIQAELAEPRAQGETLELEYRILRKDGQMLWILDQAKRATLRDGSHCFYCILMDITKQKEAHEELRLSLERHQIILDQSADIIFEWDIRQDTLRFSSNWVKKFGYEPIRQHISRGILESPNIHPEDIPAFVKIMEDTANGAPYSEMECRIRDALGGFRWSRIRATLQYDSSWHPIKAVGVILDIDADKRQKEHLLERAQRDPLTNLYNKSAIRELSEQRMEQYNIGDANTNQALLIIDVDNFKSVNDTYGHLCGDSLLSDVAGALRSHFRASDLVGRIGGDEFLVYLPSIAGKKEATQKLQNLLALLRTLRPTKDAPPISCSIGAAFFPQKDADYFTMYKCADRALYQVKAHGKNHFAFYDVDDWKNESICAISSSAIGGIDSELEGAGDAVGDKLAQYTFRMLYNSIDINTAVEHLLEIVGRAYDVSRVYIFESSRDGTHCSNTFEWCNTGVPSEIDKLQSLSYAEDLGDYLSNFDEKWVFYCHDICKLHPDLYQVLKPQGIFSILQCAIMDDGVFKGYVGFDECRESRTWTKGQLSSLTLISNILSTFLLKFRLKEERENRN